MREWSGQWHCLRDTLALRAFGLYCREHRDLPSLDRASREPSHDRAERRYEWEWSPFWLWHRLSRRVADINPLEIKPRNGVVPMFTLPISAARWSEFCDWELSWFTSAPEAIKYDAISNLFCFITYTSQQHPVEYIMQQGKSFDHNNRFRVSILLNLCR